MESFRLEYQIMEDIVSRNGGSVSTSSVYCKFDKTIVVNDTLNSKFKIRIPGSKKNRKSLYQNFQNSLTADYHTHGCVKIFKSGCQICGCKNFTSVQYIINDLETKLSVSMQKFHIHLFNVVVRIKKDLDLEFIQSKFKDYEMSYDRNVYSGLKMYFYHGEKKLTCLIFSSGSIILTGCKDGKHLESLYKIVEKISSYSKQ